MGGCERGKNPTLSLLTFSRSPIWRSIRPCSTHRTKGVLHRNISIDFPNPNFQISVPHRYCGLLCLQRYYFVHAEPLKITKSASSSTPRTRSRPAFKDRRNADSRGALRHIEFHFFKARRIALSNSFNLTASERPVKGRFNLFTAEKLACVGLLIYCNYTTCKGVP